MVHSLAHSRAFLIDSAIRLPATAPLTMLAVMPSIPADAPCATLDAACSILDRPALALLIEAFALFTSTSTTSSSLLSVAMRGYDEWFMKLPNGEHAIVDIRKLLAYCLNSQHPRGRNKARVFVSVGISEADAE